MRTPRTGLAARRRRQGMSQEALAERLGVARTTVARWETGEVEPLAWVRPALANALAVNLEELSMLLTPASTRTDIVPAPAPSSGAAATDSNPFPLDDELLDIVERRSWLASLEVGTR